MYSDAFMWWTIFSLCSKKLERVRQQALGSQGHRQLYHPSYKVLTRTGNSGRNPRWIPNNLPLDTIVKRLKDQDILWFFGVFFFFSLLIHIILCTQTEAISTANLKITLSKTYEIWQHFHEYCLQHMNKYWVFSGSEFWLSLSKSLYPLEALSIQFHVFFQHNTKRKTALPQLPITH